MTVLEFRRPRAGQLLATLRDRLNGSQSALGDRMVRTMREGQGGIREQFLRQGELKPGGGFARWKQSKRAKKVGGFTLIKTGQLQRDYLGKGPGSLSSVARVSAGLLVRVGASTPYAKYHQSDRYRTVKRKVSSNPKMMRALRKDAERFLLTGVA